MEQKVIELLEFLAKDEEEAIDGYDEVIAKLDKEQDASLIEQLTKIRDEEQAHLDFLNEAKENPNLKYEDPAHEQEEDEAAKASELFKMKLEGEKE